MNNPLFAALYDRLMAVPEASGLAAERARLLAGTSGAVLEVGAGTGLNLRHYPPGLDRLVLTDPSRPMLTRLRRRVADERPSAEVVPAPGERLPFDDATFDEAIVTLVLCSTTDPRATARELRRVLAPGGRLRFIEHVAATPHGPSRLQRVVHPLHRALSDGCRLDHSMTDTLRATGFLVEHITDWKLPAAPPWARPAVVGVATTPARHA